MRPPGLLTRVGKVNSVPPLLSPQPSLVGPEPLLAKKTCAVEKRASEVQGSCRGVEVQLNAGPTRLGRPALALTWDHPTLNAVYRREAEFYYYIAPSVSMRLLKF